jgi:hypothetical protein
LANVSRLPRFRKEMADLKKQVAALKIQLSGAPE